MNLKTAIMLSTAASIVAGALPVHTTEAQTKTPAYVVVEVKVNAADDAAYRKEFADLVRPLIERKGGRYLVRSGQSDAIEGAEPSKMAIIQFEDLQHATAAFRSPEYKELRKIGDRYGSFRIVAIEGVAKQ